MRRFRISPRQTDLRNLVLLGAILCVFVMATTPVFAQPATKAEAMQARVEKSIQIARELVNRKVYTQAQMTLDSLQGSGEFAQYVSDADKKAVAELAVVVKNALAERTRIARALMESDQLIEKGKLAEGREIRAAIRDSGYLSDGERQQVAADIAVLDKNMKALPVDARDAAKPKTDVAEELIATDTAKATEEKPKVDVETELIPVEQKPKTVEPKVEVVEPKVEIIEPKVEAVEAKPVEVEPRSQTPQEAEDSMRCSACS